MHQTSDLYRQILALPHRVESRVLIRGRAYDRTHIISLTTRGYMFKEECPSVGNVCSASIDFEMLVPDKTIPVQERILLQSRIVSGDRISEWIPKGEFWVQTRKTEIAKDGTPVTIQIYGCDAIMRSEQDYVPTGTWPKTDVEVLAEICALMGVTCNEQLGENYKIARPEDYTCRELLGYIGAMYGGNWLIAEDGQLILLRLKSNRGQGSVQPSMLYTGEPLEPITRVVLHRMDGYTFTAEPDETEEITEPGRTLNVDCPWATQKMADDILQKVEGYVYRPFAAEQAITNPAQEIGDDVGLGIIYQYVNEYFDGMITDVSAPPEEEIAHNYPYRSGGAGGRALAAARKLKEDSKSLVARVDLAEAGIVAAVKYVDLEDAEWVWANTSLFTQAGGKRAAIDLWVEGISDGEIESAASIVADSVYVNAKKATLDALTLIGDTVHVAGQVLTNSNVSALRGTVAGGTVTATDHFYLGAKEYTPKTITSFYTPEHTPISSLIVLANS